MISLGVSNIGKTVKSVKAVNRFLEEWFGFIEGRELGKPERVFTTDPKDMFNLIDESVRLRRPAYMSVQPYRAKDQPYAIEKLFFDFDSDGDLDRAWSDVSKFSDHLIRFYGVRPLIVFSGCKGYHLYVFLRRPLAFEPEEAEAAKQIYLELQRVLLRGLTLETLDRQVLGDLKRLSRIPFSLNEKSGCLCQPIDLNRRFYMPSGLLGFQAFGLSEDRIKKVWESVEEEMLLKRLRLLRSKPTNVRRRSIRPQVQHLIELAKRGVELDHIHRLIILFELLSIGCSDQEIHEVFASQKDYSPKETQYYIDHARKMGYKPFTSKRILEAIESLEVKRSWR
jgi:hypothetical protein